MQDHPKQPDLPSGLTPAAFDSLAYWRTRHEQYLLNPQGVGNAVIDVAENERIYQAMDRYVADIVRQLRQAAPVRVLDLGCGIGMLAGAFLRTGCEYTGIDISDKAVEMARIKHPTGRFEVANIADLPLSGPYDIIIERTVFIHLVEDDYWNSVIKEVKRLLSRHGVFILMDHLPLTPDEAPRSAAHVKFRMRAQYAGAFENLSLHFDTALRDGIAQHMALSPHTHFVSHMNATR
jgi:SAM-dependent methyltransferase